MTSSSSQSGEAGLLGPLPNQLKDFESKHDRSKSKKRYLNSFIHKHLPPSSFRKGIDEELKHKSFVFDNVQKKKNVIFKKRKRTLTAKEKRRLLFDKPQGSFESYQSLAALWNGYIHELIDFGKVNESKPEEIERKILKADLHGSTLVVTKSKCPSMIGCKGIVIQETQSTFKIATTDNKIKVIPKKNTDFSLPVNGWLCTIHGNNLLYRSSDRASRNFKNQSTFDIT